MIVVWILGSTGLLGSALRRGLRGNDIKLFSPLRPLKWNDPIELPDQLASAVEAFVEQIDAADRWEIYWAAGVGTMSSPVESLLPETQALEILLRLIESQEKLTTNTGGIAFASSAGAIYAGSPDNIVTERSKSAPTTAYGIEKLKQEKLLREYVDANVNASAVITRISTLYGAGQAIGKKQGLLAHIARSIVRNRPIQIYVPYDTIRDYIDADDAARVMIGLMRRPAEPERVVLKIVASEYPITIAEIISVFSRLARRAPRIIRSANKLSELYSKRIQFKSIVRDGNPTVPSKQFPVGISQLIHAERIAFTRNRPHREL